MIDIMLHLQYYVPTKSQTSEILINRTEETDQLYPWALGGDQLSAARYRGSKVIRKILTAPSKRLEGLFAVTEDWHTQAILLIII